MRAWKLSNALCTPLGPQVTFGAASGIPCADLPCGHLPLPNPTLGGGFLPRPNLGREALIHHTHTHSRDYNVVMPWFSGTHTAQRGEAKRWDHFHQKLTLFSAITEKNFFHQFTLLNGGLVCTQTDPCFSIQRLFSPIHFHSKGNPKDIFYKEYFYFSYITLCQR